MEPSNGNQTRAGNVPAIERSTKRAWDSWIAFFEAEGAATLDHAAIARLALTQMPTDLENPEWWAQGVAIAYEQHAGIRVPGQSAAGDFRVSASRTLTLPRDEALAAWVSRFGACETHRVHVVGNIRESRTEKRSFVRFSLEGAGKVEVASASKGADKTILSISQTGLTTGDQIEAWRTYWKAQLLEL
ncbi:MAG: hypothetical protein ACTIJ6_07045 [Leucobacter sp.]